MLYQVNATGTIDPRIEMHYRFHQKIDPSQYPQVHDFYEIMLVTDGKMEMEINRETELAGTGALFLIRPGRPAQPESCGGLLLYQSCISRGSCGKNVPIS